MRHKACTILLTVMLLLLRLSLFAQCETPVLSHLGDREAHERLKLFYNKKHKIFKGVDVKHQLIIIKKHDIADVLRIFRKDGSYDGVRITFLVIPKAKDSSRIAFAFTPTKPGSGRDCGGYTKSIDDTSNIYLLRDGIFNKITSKLEHELLWEWKSYYKHIVSKVKHDLKIYESESIWYSKEMMFDPYHTDSLDLLSYLDNCDSVDRIRINLGCWTKNPPSNLSCESYEKKTDIIFETLKIGQTKSKGIYFTLGGEEAQAIFNNYKDFKNIFMLFEKWSSLPLQFSDTGLPCPPNKCN